MRVCLSGAVDASLSCSIAPLDHEELVNAVTADVDSRCPKVSAHLGQIVSQSRQLVPIHMCLLWIVWD